jgi:trigger factor
MVEGATLRFPSVMIEDNINEMLQILDNNLRRSNLSIDDYKRIQNKDDRQLREDYREVANKRVRRSLVLGEIARLEGVQVTEADIQARINEMAADFGDQRDAFIKVLSSAENAQNIALDLMTAAAQQRIVEIAKGIAPALPAVTETASTETPAQAE